MWLTAFVSLRQSCDSEKCRAGENNVEQWRKPMAILATTLPAVATKSSLELAFATPETMRLGRII